MLRPRIIPVLLLSEGELVITENFADQIYVGDPINTARIFNEKLADELFIADIGASLKSQAPDFRLLGQIAEECQMPLSYAGGVNNLDQIGRILASGYEKVALGSATIYNPGLPGAATKEFGSQSISAVLDVRKCQSTGEHQLYSMSGTVKAETNIIDHIDKLLDDGVGEIIVNSVDKDGTRTGFDLELIEIVYSRTSTPITVLGGAGAVEDISSIANRFGSIGIAAGSLFSLYGNYRAVLITYPDAQERAELITSNVEFS